MKQSLLTNARYLWRELVPRTILMAIAFKWVLPMTTLFQFTGGFASATMFGIAFTGWFSLWGAYIMGGAGVQAFLEQHKDKRWLPALHIAVMVLVPVLALSLAALLIPHVFIMSWPYGPLAGAAVLNLVCATTHDWGRP